MTLFFNHIFVAIVIASILYFGCLKCEDHIFNIDEKPKEHEGVLDGLESCPTMNPRHPLILPHPGDCSKFYICDSGIQYLKECPSGLHFNPTVKSCDYPEEAKCDKGNIGIPKGKEVGDKSNLCPSESSKYPVLIPHPDDCNKFYICDGGSAHLKTCHPGLHYNAEVKACDYPEKAGCDAAFKELPKGKESGKDSNLCPSENSKFPVLLPHPDDCGKFYICDSGLAYLKECQPGLHFNPRIKTCDYPRNSGCNAGIKALSGVPSPFCPSVNGRVPIFFRHSTNCSVYYMCGNGLAYEFVCPSRLHFNLRKKACDYERNSGCQNTNQ